MPENILALTDLPEGAEVHYKGHKLWFSHLDGMWATWYMDEGDRDEKNRQLYTANFYGFTKEGDHYVPVPKPTDS